MKQFRNQNGSTLMVVMVFVALLSMMGLALITTSATHLRLQKSQEDRKSAFYLSESGIDEVIVELTEKLQTIREEAMEEANQQLEVAIQEQALIYEVDLYNRRATAEALPLKPSPVKPDPYLYEGSENGTVNQDKALAFAKETYEEYFQLTFEQWVNGSDPGDAGYTRNADYETNLSYMTHPDGADVRSRVGLRLTAAERVSFGADGTITLPFYSFYNSGKSSRKLLTVDLIAKMLDYQPIMVEQNVMEFNPNILWTKALTTDQNIVVNRGTVQIFGNVYAYGEEDAAWGDKGGILLGSGRGNHLMIKGEAVTGKDVCFIEDDSIVNMEGNVYAANMVVDVDRKGISLEVNREVDAADLPRNIAFTSLSMSNGVMLEGVKPAGDVVIENNLELRGKSSEIEIEGHYIGFMNPIQSSGMTATSCIIVDTPLDDTHNMLTIHGDTVIGGIAYLESVDPNTNGLFVTGESLAINDNYNAYKNLLTDLPSGRVGMDDGEYFSDFIKKAFPLVTDEIDQNKMAYYNTLGVFVPYSYYDEFFGPLHYSDYFYGIGTMVNDERLNDPYFEEDGTSAETIASKYEIENNIHFGTDVVFLNGRYFSYGVAFNDGEIIPGNDDLGSLSGMQSDANEMFYRQVYGLGDLLAAPDGGEADFQQHDGAGWSGIFEHFVFHGFTDDDIDADDGKLKVDDQMNEIIIVSEGDKVISGAGETIKGVIVTEGSVTLNGPLDFRGTIIAGANIIINGDVTITNDRDFIAKAMAFYGESYLKGFQERAKDEVWPTCSFKTVTVVEGENWGWDEYRVNYAITKEDYRYTHEKEARLTEKYNSIKDLVKTANWNVVEY